MPESRLLTGEERAELRGDRPEKPHNDMLTVGMTMEEVIASYEATLLLREQDLQTLAHLTLTLIPYLRHNESFELVLSPRVKWDPKNSCTCGLTDILVAIAAVGRKDG